MILGVAMEETLRLTTNRLLALHLEFEQSVSGRVEKVSQVWGVKAYQLVVVVEVAVLDVALMESVSERVEVEMVAVRAVVAVAVVEAVVEAVGVEVEVEAELVGDGIGVVVDMAVSVELVLSLQAVEVLVAALAVVSGLVFEEMRAELAMMGAVVVVRPHPDRWMAADNRAVEQTVLVVSDHMLGLSGAKVLLDERPVRGVTVAVGKAVELRDRVLDWLYLILRSHCNGSERTHSQQNTNNHTQESLD